MTETYRTQELEHARKEADAARAHYEIAKTAGEKRARAEDLEFWTNKTAFLSHAK